MKIDGKELIFKQQFYDSLDELLEYFDTYDSPNYARKFLEELHDFILDDIALRPESHSEYKWKRTPERYYRRAIFKKKYYIVFKVLPERIEFVLVVYSKRDLNNIPIE